MVYDFANLAPAHPKFIRERLQCAAATNSVPSARFAANLWLITRTDNINLLTRKHRPPVPVPSQPSLTAFGNLVRHVVRIRSKK